MDAHTILWFFIVVSFVVILFMSFCAYRDNRCPDCGASFFRLTSINIAKSNGDNEQKIGCSNCKKVFIRTLFGHRQVYRSDGYTGCYYDEEIVGRWRLTDENYYEFMRKSKKC